MGAFTVVIKTICNEPHLCTRINSDTFFLNYNPDSKSYHQQREYSTSNLERSYGNIVFIFFSK